MIFTNILITFKITHRITLAVLIRLITLRNIMTSYSQNETKKPTEIQPMSRVRCER